MRDRPIHRPRRNLATVLLSWYWPAAALTSIVCVFVAAYHGFQHQAAALTAVTLVAIYITLAVIARIGGDDRWL